MCVVYAACEVVRMLYPVSLPDSQLEESYIKIKLQISLSLLIKVIKNWRTLLDIVVSYAENASQWLRGITSWSAATAYWYCGFESRWGHACLSLVIVVCCQVQVSVSG